MSNEPHKGWSKWQIAAVILCVLIGYVAFVLSFPIGRAIGRPIGTFVRQVITLAIMGAIGYGVFAVSLWVLTGKRPLPWLPVVPSPPIRGEFAGAVIGAAVIVLGFLLVGWLSTLDLSIVFQRLGTLVEQMRSGRGW